MLRAEDLGSDWGVRGEDETELTDTVLDPCPDTDYASDEDRTGQRTRAFALVDGGEPVPEGPVITQYVVRYDAPAAAAAAISQYGDELNRCESTPNDDGSVEVWDVEDEGGAADDAMVIRHSVETGTSDLQTLTEYVVVVRSGPVIATMLLGGGDGSADSGLARELAPLAADRL